MSREKTKHLIFLAANLSAAVVLLVSFLTSTGKPVSAKQSEVLGQSSFITPVYDDRLLTDTAQRINAYRESQGLVPLSQSADLNRIAKKRAEDMEKNGYYAHKGSDGKYFYDYLKEQRIAYGFACENLNTAEKPSAIIYLRTWLVSKPHKDCLLHPSIKEAGYAEAIIKSVGNTTLNQKVIVAIYSDRE